MNFLIRLAVVVTAAGVRGIGRTCGWVPFKSGLGSVSINCGGDHFPMIRNSRLPGKTVSCP
jgi:hypothetical protein